MHSQRVDPERTLETARLLLEPLGPQHATALYAPLNDPRLYLFIPQDPPSSPQRLRERYVALAARRSPDGREVWLNWVMRRRDTGADVGTVEATVLADRTALLAYMVFPPYQGQGFAREGCARMLAHLVEDYHVRSVAADIDTRNSASIHLVEALGFERIGTTRSADFFKGTPSDEYRYEHRASKRAQEGNDGQDGQG